MQMNYWLWPKRLKPNHEKLTKTGQLFYFYLLINPLSGGNYMNTTDNLNWGRGGFNAWIGGEELLVLRYYYYLP